ncbi:MAG: DegT/DnrJ/EryC1/StrS family aminotransferase [Candidatus Parcubacteria bacterium]|nr:DegT/DnrJ/EryC1/StrS family aminotransferase [Candidatus Parcubacteria bacterium]
MIPVCRPDISQKEIKWVNRALKENRISSTGGFVELFEKEFAKKIGTKYAVACNSGGSALFLALSVFGIKKGDEVIIPDFTMVATANAVKQCGAKPVLVDAEFDTCNINPDLIEKKITKKTKAIIPVHLYGHPCQMDKIMKIARKHKLYVIEDAAEAHGARFKGKLVGSIGDMGCFSFYANKIITTGEGGAITTNKLDLAQKLNKLRAYYFSDEKHFWHAHIGFNFRMSSLEAAFGLGQLERWEELIEKRRKNSEYYTAHLKKLIGTPIEKNYAYSVFWMYLIKVGKQRDKLMEYLQRNGVETRTGFFPMHWQPIYKEKNSYPVSDILGKTTLYLPSASDLTKNEKDRVIKMVKKFYQENK